MISALLIDLDGTVYSHGKAYPGVAQVIDWLRDRNMPFRYITNTTGRSREVLASRLTDLGVSSSADELFIAPQAAALYCRKRRFKRIWLATRDDEVAGEFDGLTLTQDNPDAVVLADLADQFTYDKMNQLLHALLGGAELVAMQRGRYWLTEQYGHTLDLGPYVAALEYATNKKATVVGKPSKAFFDLALEGWDFPRNQIAVVGDSVENDLAGAVGANLRSIMVRSGVYEDELAASEGLTPDLVINSMADLPEALEKL